MDRTRRSRMATPLMSSLSLTQALWRLRVCQTAGRQWRRMLAATSQRTSQQVESQEFLEQ